MSCFGKKTPNFILDGELVYLDKEGNLLAFQDIDRKLQTTQGEGERRNLIEDTYINGKRPKLFAFDILALNKDSLCHLDYDERMSRLEGLLDSPHLREACERDLIQLSDRTEIKPDDLVTEISEAQRKAVDAGCEGIIVKSRDARYETNGTRVNTWIKLKNTNLQSSSSSDSTTDDLNIRDTLDLIPIGGFYGKGSRTGLFGSYLMAAYSVNL